MLLEFAGIVPAVFNVPAVIHDLLARLGVHKPALAQHIEYTAHLARSIFGKGHKHRPHAQLFFHVDEGFVQRIVGIVQLVYKQYYGHARLAQLAESGNGLRFDTARGTHHKHGTFHRRKRHVDLRAKIHMARSINKVEPSVLPLKMSDTALDGNAAFLFLGHVVHSGKAFLDFARAAHLARRKQYAFRKRRLARIYVGKDRNIADGVKCLSTLRHT